MKRLLIFVSICEVALKSEPTDILLVEIFRKALLEAAGKQNKTIREISREAGITSGGYPYQLYNGDTIGSLKVWDKLLTAANVQIGYRIVLENKDQEPLHKLSLIHI